MKTPASIKSLALSIIALSASAAALAQNSADQQMLQRNVQQEQRIEQGLKSGALNTREAGRLEKKGKVDKLEAKALRDGKLSPKEQARIDHAQGEVSQDIHAAKTNEVRGNPDSASSKRLQADVQRNVNEQERIAQGAASGALTPHETARLERGQARVDRREARAAHDGHVGAHEQARIARTEGRQSHRIFRQKHDAQKQG